MKIKHGLISADFHAQLNRDAFVSRMSKAKFGDTIPCVIETSDKSMMYKQYDHPVDRWMVNGRVMEIRGVTNSPAVMGDPTRETFPQRWEEIPPEVYDPIQRVKVLDSDRVDAEVLFPNPPVLGAAFFQKDAEFELACVQAYNDAIIEWRQASDRYIPLALIPYLSGIQTTVAEVERAAKAGFRGILMLAEPSAAIKNKIGLIFENAPVNSTLRTLGHFNDPYWDPLWAACQDLGIAINWHANAGLQVPVSLWKGYEPNQVPAVFASCSFCGLGPFLPNLIFSGVLDRYPQLKWVCAETGLSWLNYVAEACDHEWERRRLWSEGVLTRPSELLRRQIYVAVWFEKHGIETRHDIGVEKIMWESDFPHTTSTYPKSRELVEGIMGGVPEDERRAMLWENATRLYGLEISQ